MKSRVSDIRLLLQCNKTVYTRQLVKLFQVDSRTIRRDLIQLEQLGIAERFYGGAHFIQSSDKTQKLDSINLGDFVPQSKEYSAQKIGQKKKEGSSGRIITLGSFNVDIINRVKRFPVPGETVHAMSTTFSAGGKGANQAYAASQSQANVHFITKIGSDQFHYFAKNYLYSVKFQKLTLLESDQAATGNAIILVNEEGENMITIDSGANTQISTLELQQAMQDLTKNDLFLTQMENNIDAIKTAIQIVTNAGVKVILNPAPYTDEVPSLIPLVHIVTPNETEASSLSGINVIDLESAKQAALEIQKMGVPIVIITLGHKGVLVLEKKFTYVPAFNAVVQDTTGAGDAFNGAFVSELLRGSTIIVAAEYATAYASLAVERRGASTMPTRKEALERLKIGRRVS